MAAAAGVAGVAGSAFEVVFAGPDETPRRGSLAECWSVPFERVAPCRRFVSFRGQKNFTGLRWTATTGSHVGFESWLERDHVMLLDFDPAVVGIASQPFTLVWREGERERRHTPDYFVRREDGSGAVIDVRPDKRIEPEDAEAFAATERACREVGWGFQRVGTPDPVFTANVRWLAGFRAARCCRPETAAALLEVFMRPAPLFAGAEAVGPRIVVLPTLFHLLWRRVLVAELRTEVLGRDSLVTRDRRRPW